MAGRASGTRGDAGEGTGPESVRRHNLSAILRHVHAVGPTSRAELTTRMGLNRSTIGALTAELAGAGLVREQEPPHHARAGRPSLLVVPESGRVFALAFDIGPGRLTAALVGLGGRVLARRAVALAADEPGDERDGERNGGCDGAGGHGVSAPAVAAQAGRLTGLLLSEVPADARCVGVGAAIAGVVSGDGLVRFGPNLGWVDQPLGALLAARLGVRAPVVVGNDGDLGALAEHRRGAAAGRSDVVYLSGEVGVGAGIISGGRPLTGHGGYGGEVGHVVINPRGRRCRCGSRGCWETEIGAEALLRLAGQPPGGAAGVTRVLQAAAGGDPTARAALRRVGRWLGIGVGNLVNVFDPEVVVFGGLLREVFPAVEPVVRRQLHRVALAAPREHVDLTLPLLGADSPLVGAAELAFADLLRDPLAPRPDAPVRARADRDLRAGRARSTGG